jgi:pimeloyl-ACP methyl ester carboxylesterase
VLWQHGLGATFEQPLAVFPELAVTRITLACRGHEDSDLGPPADLSIATFTKDVLALLDHVGVRYLTAAGGISLGAAIALRLAAYQPGRVGRLVIARPAWVDEPAGASQRPYVEAGRHLALLGPNEGMARFRATSMFRDLEAESPDNAKSLLGYFTRSRPETTVALLERLPNDWPGVPRSMLQGLAQPTLVIGNGEDVTHPLEHCRAIIAMIPDSRLEIVPSKSVDPAGYTAEFRLVLERFIEETVT